MRMKIRYRKSLGRLLRSRKGTAEIVGSVLFLVIMFFFFTNVYLWHDQATRIKDNLVLDRVNSLVSIRISGNILNVTNDGGVGFSLSRLWIITSGNHNYADFEKGQTIWVEGGVSMSITLTGTTQTDPLDGSYSVNSMVDPIEVYYNPSEGDIFRILTDLGNTAACQYGS